MKLLIVESPSKSKTIEHYLGSDYKVVASLGHIRDLRIKGKGGFGVDVENNFQPEYAVLPEKEDKVKELKVLADSAEHVYLATDPDREGEAISWHLQEVLDQDPAKVSRIVFNEITKTAVTEALNHDRQVDMNIVHSQESRRIIDRIIGFRLSSLLQQKLGSKSAGRVQSVALKLIVDREKEIEAFEKLEYWDVFSDILKDDKELKAKLVGFNGEKFELHNESESTKVVDAIKNSDFVVSSIETKERKRVSAAPFITSTLEQDAGSRFKFNAKRTMLIAQKLYEGIDLDKERVGLITYMRTDSTRLSDDFLNEAKKYIKKNFGDKYYKGYKIKAKKGQKIQDAHEAIRPTSLDRTPAKMKKYLTSDELKIYTIIYNRALASNMSDALIEDTFVTIDSAGYNFNLSGQTVLFDGFQKLFDEVSEDETVEITKLPELIVGEKLKVNNVHAEQKFTNPPYRYTEVRLIKKMEDLGIGRPSTYALTMETLRLRSYVTMDKRTFVPSEQGRLTSDQLDIYFKDIINVKYTANMESRLDAISDGEVIWHEEVRKFYEAFMPMVEDARDNMIKIYPKKTDEFCPVCGLPLFIRRGPFGEFTACSGYPHCKYIKKKPKVEPVHTGITCPLCGKGDLVERINVRGRNKGTLFYACSEFPSCKATYSGLPTGDKCEVCGGPMIKVGEEVYCGNEKCKTNRERYLKERFKKKEE